MAGKNHMHCSMLSVLGSNLALIEKLNWLKSVLQA